MRQLKTLEIERLVQSLGVGRNYMGYNILVQAVKFAYDKPDTLLFVTKELYPELAKICDTSVYSIERNIRTVSHIMFQRMPYRLNELALYDITEAPSASQLIDILVNYFMREKELYQ